MNGGGIIARTLRDAQQHRADWQIEIVPADHPYALGIVAIRCGIIRGKSQ